LAVRAEPLVRLLRFLVRRVLCALPAVLLRPEPVGVRAPVPGGRVVPPLALSTRQSDDLAHGLLRDLRDDARPHRPPALPDRKPQLLLHRHRLDQLDRHRHVVAGHHHLHPPRQRPPPLPTTPPIATGWISSIAIVTLSPGITISTPPGSVHTPVTSVVRK